MGNLARHRYTCWGRMHPPELYTSAEAPAPSCSFCKPCHQDSKLAPRLHEGSACCLLQRASRQGSCYSWCWACQASRVCEARK